MLSMSRWPSTAGTVRYFCTAPTPSNRWAVSPSGIISFGERPAVSSITISLPSAAKSLRCWISSNLSWATLTGTRRMSPYFWSCSAAPMRCVSRVTTPTLRRSSRAKRAVSLAMVVVLPTPVVPTKASRRILPLAGSASTPFAIRRALREERPQEGRGVGGSEAGGDLAEKLLGERQRQCRHPKAAASTPGSPPQSPGPPRGRCLCAGRDAGQERAVAVCATKRASASCPESEGSA